MALPPNVVRRFSEGQFRGVVTGSVLLDITTGESIKFSDLVSGGTGVPVTSSSITDATVVGKAVLTATDASAAQTAIGATAVGKQLLVAADAAAARTAIGAGTSNLVVGTTSTTALAGNTVIPAAYTLPNATTTVRGGVLQAAAQVNSTAVDVAGLLADFNALLAKLRAGGHLAP